MTMNGKWLALFGLVISVAILLSSLGQWVSGYGGLQDDVGGVS